MQERRVRKPPNVQSYMVASTRKPDGADRSLKRFFHKEAEIKPPRRQRQIFALCAQHGFRRVGEDVQIDVVGFEVVSRVLACVDDRVVSATAIEGDIGFDKSEIIEVARKIGTLEISELPFEDCCTVFTPRHPATHPKMDKILEGEAKLDTEALIQRALEGVEMVRV